MAAPEVWKTAPAPFSRYEVSSLGRVRSYCARAHRKPGEGSGCVPGGRTTTARLMQPCFVPDRYVHIGLRADDGTLKTWLMHRLVLTTFLGPCPDKETWTGSHMNGDKHDNAIDNLCWEPMKSNVRRQTPHGTSSRNVGETNGGAKLTADDVTAIRKAHAQGARLAPLAQEFGVSTTTICKIVHRQKWKSVA